MNEPFEWHWETTIREKDAEILRLNKEVVILERIINMEERSYLKSLITELADALAGIREDIAETYQWKKPYIWIYDELIQKAREAVK